VSPKENCHFTYLVWMSVVKALMLWNFWTRNGDRRCLSPRRAHRCEARGFAVTRCYRWPWSSELADGPSRHI